MQSKANLSIAVGYQNECNGTFASLKNIYNQYGIMGLWRGQSAVCSSL